MNLDLKKVKSVHLIGIGGIGISAIARMMILEGKKVSGSDRSRSLITDDLKHLGAKIFIGHSAKNIPQKCDLVIYTVAISEDNPELEEAKKRKILMLTYPEVLGIISKNKFTIAVSGTSGKTTTTAMIAKILIDAGLDPTVIVGSLLPEHGSNFVAGQSNILVLEADEYKRAFHNLWPSILVITNITCDHLDYFKDLEDIQNAFNFLAHRVPESGFIVCVPGDLNISPAIKQVKCKVADYSQLRHSVSKLKLKVPGEHNRQNAAAALAVAKCLGISPSIAIGALNKFGGTWRRFEYKGKVKATAVGGASASVYDDYAHNPEKVRAALAGARELVGDKRILTIFQPHLFSRTKLLLDEFARSFGDTDELILLSIYAAREQNDPSINSEILAREIFKKNKNINMTVVSNKDEAATLARSSAANLVITMGAGDVTEISDWLTK